MKLTQKKREYERLWDRRDRIEHAIYELQLLRDMCTGDEETQLKILDLQAMLIRDSKDLTERMANCKNRN